MIRIQTILENHLIKIPNFTTDIMLPMMRKFTLLIGLFITPFLVYSQNIVIDNTTIDACSGFFLDTGTGANNYGPNEDFTMTICSDGGPSGTHVQLNFSGVELGAGDQLCFYDGTDTGAPLLACADDFSPGAPFIIQATAVNNTGCLTITFTSDAIDEGPGWSAVLECIPACQLITAILSSSDPTVVPVDTGYIDICPGQVVFFTGAGMYPQNGIVYNHSDLTSSFEWDFGDGNFGIGPNVSHIYTEPGGYIVQLTITDQFGCTNTNFISQRVRVSTAPIFSVGGDLPQEICILDTINLAAMINQVDTTSELSVFPVEGSFQADGIRSDSLALPDGTGASYETSISFTAFSPGQVLTDINDLLGICVEMEHSYMRDLEIMLTCPDGTTITLHNFAGQTGGEVFLGEPFEADEFGVPVPGVGYEYCWTPDATMGTWIEYANSNNPQTLPPGDYNSFDPLTDLLGCPLNGEWTISVQDLWGVDNGFIFSWSINFATDLYPELETFTPELIDWSWVNQPSIFYQDMDSIAAAPINAGVANYTFEVTNDFGCTFDTTVTVDVLPITHPDCYNCQDILNPVPDTAICSGDPVMLDVSTNQGPTVVPFETYPNFEIGFANAPPNAPYLSTIPVNSINPAVITDPVTDIVSVCFDLETNFLGDIKVFLQTPSGQLFELTTDNGGTSDFYSNTCFTPTAVTPITAGATPFTGNFLPEENWNNLIGEPINGNWTLVVSDDAGITTFGTFNSWSITFNSTNEVSYLWTPFVGLDCTNCPDPTANPATSTQYIVDAIDAYGCIAADTVNIAVGTTVPAPTLSCDDSVPGQITFSWPQVDTFTNYVVNVDNNGWVPANGMLAHTVGGLPNGAIVTIEVEVAPGPTVCSVETATLTCQGCYVSLTINSFKPQSCFNICDGNVEVAAVSGTAPYTYTVTHEDNLYTFTQVDDGFFGNLCAGVNSIVVEDATGCSDSTTVVITAPDSLTADAFQIIPVSCNGGNDGQAMVDVQGGNAPYTFQWDDPLAQILPMATLLEAGPLTVVITDANGCMATAMTTIEEPEVLVLVTDFTDALCFGEASGTATAMPSGGVYPYNYLWNDPNSTMDSIATELGAGNYLVEVTDANGCLLSQTVSIGQPATPVAVTIDQTAVGCFGEDTSEALATASGGTGPDYSYAWSNGDLTQTATDLGAASYTVTATDANGCEVVESINISQYDPLEILVIFSPVSCNGGNDGALAVTNIEGGSGGTNVTYQWSANPALNADVIEGLAGGVTYTVTVTDDGGCSAIEDIFLPQPQTIEVQTAVTDVLCFGDATGTATVTNVDNATPPYTYNWGANANNQITQTASDLAAGTYTVQVTDGLGCETVANVEILQPTPIDIEFSVISNECFGDMEGSIGTSIEGGVGGYSYNWSNNGVGPQISNLLAGQYVITVTDDNACEQIDSVQVLQPEPIDPILFPDNVTCFGDRDGAITVEPTGGTAPFLYSLDGENYTGSSTLIGLTAGEYGVYIQDGNGCVWYEETFVSQPLEIEVISAVGEEVTIDLGQTIELGIEVSNNLGNYQVEWIAPYEGTLSCVLCPNPVSNTQNTITYDVYVVDEQGCETATEVTVRVIKERVVLVPTAFSPNNDGNNDLLLVHGKEGTLVELFQVFDRWGELVYEDRDFLVNDPDRGWNGVFRGQLMNSGVFIWYVEAEYIDGDRDTFKGSTTLIR